MKKIIYNFCFLFLTYCLIPSVKADNATPPPIQGGTNLPGGNQALEAGQWLENTWLLNTFLPNVLQWVLGVLASAAIIVIMIGGYMYLTSFGGEQVDKAKDTIMYGVIGLLVVILSYAIVSIVQNLPFFT